MSYLNDKLKLLKKNYEMIFKDSYSQIDSAVCNLSEHDCKIYLENRLKKFKNEAVSFINDLKLKSKCSGCGICCRFAVSEYSYNELEQKAKKGDNYAAQFISIFVPYDSPDEYENIFPQYIKLLSGQKYYVYHCPKVTEDNKCPEYDNRPQICKDFPDNPAGFLPPSCGFMDWKLKSEPVWLKLRAEIEIINYFLEKI